MSRLHLGMTALSIVLTVGAALLYGLVLLYGAWVDGRRQHVRDRGLHPTTEESGVVHAREEESVDVGERS